MHNSLKHYQFINSLYYSLEEVLQKSVLQTSLTENDKKKGINFPYLIILPNEESVENAKTILSDKLVNYSTRNITTEKRLIDDLTGLIKADKGLNNNYSLTKNGKNALLRKILSEVKKESESGKIEAKYVSKLMNSNRFIKDVSSLIAVLKSSYHKEIYDHNKSLINISKIDDFFKKISTGRISTEKFRDINTIINRYEDYKTKLNLKDREDELIETIHYLNNSSKLNLAFIKDVKRISVCGVYETSPINIDFLEALSNNMGCELFISVYESAKNTSVISQENKKDSSPIIKYLNSLGFSELESNKEKSLFQDISKNLFKENIDKTCQIETNEIKDKVRIIKESTNENEVITVLKRIKELLISGEALPKDIVIISPNIDSVKSFFRKTAKKMGIDIYISKGDLLGNQKIIYVLLAILEIKLYNFKYTHFMKLIKSNYVFVGMDGRFTKDCYSTIERFFSNRKVDEDHFIEQMESYLKYVENTSDKREAQEYNSDKISEAINYAKTIKEMIFPTTKETNHQDTLPEADKLAKFSDISNAYKKLIEKDFSILLNVFKSKNRSDNENYYTEEDLVIAKRDSIVFGKFIEIIDELNFYYNIIDEKITLRDFYSILKLSLLETTFHEDTDSRNKVQILEIEKIPSIKSKYLFLTGMLENVFPRKMPNDIYISEEEKAKINTIISFNSIINADKFYKKEEDLFKISFSVTEKTIFLSWSEENEGESTLTSFFVDELIEFIKTNSHTRLDSKDIKTLLTEEESKLIFYEEEFINKTLSAYKESFHDIDKSNEDSINKMFHVKLSDVKNTISQVINKDNDYLEKLFETIFMNYAKNSRIYTHFDGNLFYNVIQKKDEEIKSTKTYFENIFKKMAPTDFEMYGTCPMRFYFNRVLNIKETSVTEDIIESTLRGDIVHRILERFYRDFVKERITNLDTSKVKEVKEELENELIKIFNEEFLSLKEKSRIYDYKIFELKQMVFIKEKLIKFFNEDFYDLIENGLIPTEFEYDFGKRIKDSDTLIEIEGDDKTLIKIKGSIDRIDVPKSNTDKQPVRVSDYKTEKSRKAKNKIKNLIDEGRIFQPTIYAIKGLEYSKNLNNYENSLEWFFYYILSKDDKKHQKIDLKEGHELITKSVEYIKDYKKKINAGKFHLAPKESPSYCKYRSACGYIKHQTEEKGNESGFWK